MKVSDNVDKKRINNDLRNIRRKISRARGQRLSLDGWIEKFKTYLVEIDKKSESVFDSFKKNSVNQNGLQSIYDTCYICGRYDSLQAKVLKMFEYLKTAKACEEEAKAVMNEKKLVFRIADSDKLEDSILEANENLYAFFKCLHDF